MYNVGEKEGDRDLEGGRERGRGEEGEERENAL